MFYFSHALVTWRILLHILDEYLCNYVWPRALAVLIYTTYYTDTHTQSNGAHYKWMMASRVCIWFLSVRLLLLFSCGPKNLLSLFSQTWLQNGLNWNGHAALCIQLIGYHFTWIFNLFSFDFEMPFSLSIYFIPFGNGRHNFLYIYTKFTLWMRSLFGNVKGNDAQLSL